MNLSDITTRGWILALFIRDDGERFLLGDGWYDFKDGLQHFQPNTIANDIVELQGTDGQLLAGQVRRSAAQKFNGYIGDSTIPKTEIETRRMAFLQFFQVRRNYDVIYIFPDGTSIKRERGYLVEAPSVPEMWQFYPEYSVALNFENVNYYEYAEDDAGQEIFVHSALVAISNSLKGGLIWDGSGAYSEPLNWSNFQTKSGSEIQITDAIAGAPMSLTQLSGNAEQTTYSGKNLFNISKVITNGTSVVNNGNGTLTITTPSASSSVAATAPNKLSDYCPTLQAGDTATFSMTTTGTNKYIYLYGTGANVLWGDRNAKVITQDLLNAQILWYASGVSTTATISDIQIELGNTATAYEPYVGGTASPNPDYPQAIETVTGGQTVSVVGKNLCSSTSVPVATQVYFNFDKNTITAGTYTLSTALNEATANNTVSLLIDGTATNLGTFAGSAGATVKTTFTLSEAQITSIRGSTTSLIRLYKSGASFTNPAWAQLELGSQATAYTPYQGQSYDVNLGKNLFTSDIYNQLDVSASAELQSDGFYKVRFASNKTLMEGEFQPNTQYTISAIAYGGASGNSGVFGLNYTDGTSETKGINQTTAYNYTLTSTAGKTIKNIKITYGSQNVTYIKNLQLELGTQATSYAPYFTPIELAKIGTYQDYIWNDDGVWKIHKEVGKVVLDSSNQSNWGVYQTGTQNWFYYWQTVQDALVGNAEALMSNYGFFNSIGATDTNQGIMIATNGLLRVRLGEELPIADWKAKVAASQMVVYYRLATPTDTAITDDTLLAQLNTISELYGGVNNISLVPSAGAQGTMEIKYATELLPGGGYVWQEGDTGGVTNVNVIGVANTQPIWTVTGPAVDPTLTNITTGQAITWSGTVPNGQTLVVDMGKQTAELNGANVYSGISGDWIDLEIGQNKLTYSAIGGDIPPSRIEWNGVVG